MLVDVPAIGAREFEHMCLKHGGTAATFGVNMEPHRPPVFRWYGLQSIATAFGGGFESVAMRDAVPTRETAGVSRRRWIQMLQLEWHGEVSLVIWPWAADKRGISGVWNYA